VGEHLTVITDLGPREVMKADIVRHCQGEGKRMASAYRGDLVGNRQQPVESLVADDPQVGRELAVVEVVLAGLDLDQPGPRPLTWRLAGKGDQCRDGARRSFASWSRSPSACRRRMV